MKSKVKHLVSISLFVAPVIIFIAIVVYNCIVNGMYAHMAIM